MGYYIEVPESRGKAKQLADQRAARIVRQEVLCCVSALVATLAQGCVSAQDSFGHNNAQEISDLAEQAADLCSPVLDYEDAAIQAGWESDISTGNTNWFNSNFVRSAAEALHNAQQVHEGEARKYIDDICALYVSAEGVCAGENIDPYDRDVFEHWAVSDWLADKLIEQGEKVDKDFAGLCVWARTTTGQGIASDYVIEKIARALEN